MEQREVARPAHDPLLVQVGRQLRAKRVGGASLAGCGDIVVPALDGQERGMTDRAKFDRIAFEAEDPACRAPA